MLDITGYVVQDLPSAFGVSAFVSGVTIPRLIESGLPVDGLIDNAANGGRSKWEGLGATPVLFRGSGKHSDRFLQLGWAVVPVIGRPLMPCNDGRGWRPDHVPGFEPVWMLATPPGAAFDADLMAAEIAAEEADRIELLRVLPTGTEGGA